MNSKTTTNAQSYFVISLDFELFWGMSDTHTIESYGENILGVHTALPRILELFSEYNIHATWATVGMLMARSKHELIELLPHEILQPTYDDARMSTYHHLNLASIGNNEVDDPYHFGSSLVTRIIRTPNQELGNHTFSHYYAIDGAGNNSAKYGADLEAHARIANEYGVTTTSIVFPRNQWSEYALEISRKYGIRAYRGNEDHVLYRARRTKAHSPIIRAFRLLDHYLNVSGHHTYPLPKIDTHGLVNIPASRFLRPYMPLLSFLEPLRLRRIKKSMTHAAKRGEIFHLWWHPHNFGVNQEQNFENLTEILKHFKALEKEYGMQSASMRDITARAHTSE